MLVVGDESDACQTLAGALRDAGFEVNNVHDLDEAASAGRCESTVLLAEIDEVLENRTPTTPSNSIDADDPRIPNFVGDSPCVRLLARRVYAAARHSGAVSIHGGTGSGKSLVARAIHLLGPRRNGPYVTAHINGDPSATLHRSLFGHRVRGAGNTIHVRPGRIAQADGGTLYLEHVDRLPAKVQLGLLEFLAAGSAEIAGGGERFEADVRIVGGSRDGLDIAVAAGRLHPDLYAKLEETSIPVPPLRVRRQDVGLLAMHFQHVEAAKNDRKAEGFSEEALRKLANYSWPGNVHQLKRTIKRAHVAAEGGKICARHLHIERHSATGNWRHMPPIPGSSLDDIERYAILETLEQVEGDKAAAADLLGISVRKVQYCVRRYSDTASQTGSD